MLQYSQMADNKKFYVGQKAFINKDGELLVLFNNNGGLDFPGGQIQEGEEDLETALKREVTEETTLDITVGKPIATWNIEVESPQKSVFMVGYKCEYVSGEVCLSEEHTRFVWLNKQNFQEYKQNTIWFSLIEQYFYATLNK